MVPFASFLAVTVAFGAGLTTAQAPLAKEHSTAFNSTFSLTTSQSIKANLSASRVNSINNVIRFDRTQLANGGSFADDFYTLPSPDNVHEQLAAGTLLKVEEVTNPGSFALPPNTALSRILYLTKNLNGSVIPASAFILWPYQPRTFTKSHRGQSKKAPVVLWTHGTSGYFASGGPSMMRSLWYGDPAVYPLALDGYAVVAPDYAGLGVGKTWEDSEIPHQYLCSTASAYDALYALQAAHAAFTERLTEEFVVFGHSQGGGVAWRTAEILTSEAETFSNLSLGHLGTISGSPTTEVFSALPQFIAPGTALAIKKIFPSFEFSNWFTPLGEGRLRLLKEIEGSVGVLFQLFSGEDAAKLLKDGVEQSWYAKAYSQLSDAGRRQINKPMVVIQGMMDPYISYNTTVKTFKDTCAKHPKNDMELHVVTGAEHVSSLYPTRRFWLQWIQDRFEKKPVANGCFRNQETSWLPLKNYSPAGNSLIVWAGLPEFSYETILGP